MISSCANCGKGEGCDLKKCSACKMVQYCSVDCQKAHRPQHKRDCKKRAAEIFDEALFKQPPLNLNEDCPICFLSLPSLTTGRKYQSCCGKMICGGCVKAVLMDIDAKCPFCRVSVPRSDEDLIERIKKRVEMDDAEAIRSFGCCYYNGEYGVPQDYEKALQLWHRAGELGNATANCNIGNAHYNGNGVERDMKQAKHYWALAAVGGDEVSRYNLGSIIEERAGNMSKALKHHMIAAGCGYNNSLKRIKEFYMNGHATKDDYAKALRAHQKYVDGIKSAQRDEAAAFNNEKYRYCY